MDGKIELKTIYELLDQKFFIPDYQRGYRWTPIQVKQLLDDIWDFCKKENKTEGEFYCLQPIVVKKHNEDKWEVIDGQQRLTTILLIIHYFNEMWVDKQKIPEPKISYATRPHSSDFISSLEIETENFDTELKIDEVLDLIKVKSISPYESNIDYFHIANAYKTIHFWVKKLGKELDNDSFKSIFQRFTKVIWYEFEESNNDNSIDIFTRLNIGKIPLTNAELIKALFLQKGNFSESEASLKQIQIATEWDNIEKTLQDDSFWYFIYNPENPLKYDNRIEYIFDLMKNRKPDSEYYHTFNEFYKDFPKDEKDKKLDIDKIWLEIKKYFLTFEEWYKDHVLYHYIGFLIDCGVSINEIKKESENKTKIEFKNYLKEKIKKQIDCNRDGLKELEYGDKRIKKILLLFNIQTILDSKKSEMRFPFHKYKKENWDIEHVRSQTEKHINSKKHQLEWINDILDYFFGTTDLEKIEDKKQNNKDEDLQEIMELLIALKQSEKIDSKKFEEAFGKMRKYFKEDNQVENINNISNLTLLDSETNRSYKNSFFPIKRKRIIKNDANGIFVPIATKNLFLKYYSKRASENMYWTNDDAEDYLDAIETKLKDFLPEKESNNGKQ